MVAWKNCITFGCFDAKTWSLPFGDQPFRCESPCEIENENTRSLSHHLIIWLWRNTRVRNAGSRRLEKAHTYAHMYIIVIHCAVYIYKPDMVLVRHTAYGTRVSSQHLL